MSPPPAAPPPPGTAAEHETLPPGTRFGEFEIVRVLGIGGFGIVYLARDHSLERDVALKEYMPASLATRGQGPQITVRSAAFAETYAIGLRSFVNEARLLARFDHASLVKVYRFWEDNATAYMVMPYLQGITLRDTRRAMTSSPDERWIRSVIDPIMSALEQLHRAGVYHRDIAPDNILLPTEGPPVLLDFGAARRVISDRTQSLTAILKPSYAPIEQYAEMSQLRQGPWTDLYALGAVVHFLLFGQPPAPATARALQEDHGSVSARGAAGVSPRFLEAVDWALAIRPNQRPQTVDDLRSALDGRVAIPALGPQHITVPGALAAAVAAPPPPTPTPPSRAFEQPTLRVETPVVEPTRVPTANLAPSANPPTMPWQRGPQGPQRASPSGATAGFPPPAPPTPSTTAFAPTAYVPPPVTQPPHTTGPQSTLPPQAAQPNAPPQATQAYQPTQPYPPTHQPTQSPRQPAQQAAPYAPTQAYVPPHVTAPPLVTSPPYTTAPPPRTAPPGMPPTGTAPGSTAGPGGPATVAPRAEFDPRTAAAAALGRHPHGSHHARPAPPVPVPVPARRSRGPAVAVVVLLLLVVAALGAWLLMETRAKSEAAGAAASAAAQRPGASASASTAPLAATAAPAPAAAIPADSTAGTVGASTETAPSTSATMPATAAAVPSAMGGDAAAGPGTTAAATVPTNLSTGSSLATPATGPAGAMASASAARTTSAAASSSATAAAASSAASHPRTAQRGRPDGALVPAASPVPEAPPPVVADTHSRPVPPAATPAADSRTPGPASAKDACGGRVFLALAMCMERECEDPRFRNSAECIPVLERKRQRDNR